jgi:hypothetical protein
MSLLRVLVSLLLLTHAFQVVEPVKFRGKVVRRRFEYPDDREEDVLYLVQGTGGELRIEGDQDSLESVVSGTEIEGDGKFTADVVTDVRNISIVSQSPGPGQTRQVQLKSITFVLNICNRWTVRNGTSDVFKAKTLYAWASPKESTLEGFFDSCSIGSVRMTTPGTYVTDPINIPCEAFNASTCTEREFVGWAQYAEKYARDALKVNLTNYNHRIFVIPYTAPCAWLGLADVGCPDWCRSWIKGGSEGYSLQSLFHELGHNLGLRHATGLDGSEYGDFTGAMGGCCTIRCHNAPQAWSLGWFDPIMTLNDSVAWKPKETLTFHLPAMLTTRRNFVRIDNTMFLSYRPAMGYDSKMPSAGSVHVHSFNGSRSNRYFRTQLLAVVPRGKSFVDNRTQWIMNVTNANGTHASVSLCKTTCDPCAGVCGNGVCEAYAGETCETCPQDCARGVTKWGPFCCGAEGQCKFHWRCTNQKLACETVCPASI